MTVCADQFYQSLIDQFFSKFFYGFGIIAGQGKEVQLKRYVSVRHGFQQFQVMVKIKVSFRMCEIRLVTIHFQFKKAFEEHAELTHESRFHQHVVLSKSEQSAAVDYLLQK